MSQEENKKKPTSVEPKSKHQQIIDIVSNVVAKTTRLGIVHLESEDNEIDGKYVTVNGQKLLFFGSCGYLGIEKHPEIINAGVDALQKYGAQFSSSRAYISSKYYTEAEDLLSQMFGKPALLMQSLTLGHITNIPILVGDNDAVILDHQVHDSVQTAVNMLKLRNIKIEVIRHNNMQILEDRIRILKNTHDRIWYLADGVYSMMGDVAPIKELYALADKYEQLYLYLDDIHGMSWDGPNGTGFVTGQAPYHPKLYLTTGLTKAFGTAGGVLIYPDHDTHRLIKSCGKGFIFSIQIPPSIIASTIAACKIHMSNEIVDMQNKLKEKIAFFKKKIKEYDLPVIGDNHTPIFFIGVGKTDVGYNMCTRMMKAGFLFNLSVFPAMSLSTTGLRIPINNHLSEEDMDSLLSTLAENLPAALEEQDSSIEEIKKAFKIA
jgi:7-keto-8-aminopelargonate synthetase-like enzyme